MKYAIQVKGLSFYHRNQPVLQNLSFDIKKGEIIYVIGGNGSGKTTLLKLLIGLIKPTKGTIQIFGEKNVQSIIAKYFGYVPQHFNVERDFPLSVMEMIELECPKRTTCPIGPKKHLRYLNSENLLNKKISDLSGGEMQKVLIARSMVTHPEILLLDEPFNNLDHKTEHLFIEMLRQLNKQSKTTILLVTHDLNIVPTGDINNKAKVLFITHGKAQLIETSKFKSIHKLQHI